MIFPPDVPLDRRGFLARAGSAAGLCGLGALGSSCATPGGPRPSPPAAFAPTRRLARLRITPERLMRITVCTRPFRGAGPRLDAEAMGTKRVVHNYGHGGAGWSLSWGCAEDAVGLVAEGGLPSSVAVIGAGVIGMTTALRLAETGVPVTVYAEAFPAETRSARATGVWSPASRIGLADQVEPDFIDRWEGWARRSYPLHQRLIGALGDPVEMLPRYGLFDSGGPPRVPASREFLELWRRVNDLTPPARRLAPAEHPFPVDRARWSLQTVFNVTAYMETLTRQFLLRDGKMVRRSFPDQNSILALDEPVIVNCTGYGARALFGDETLSPVRGQINWFAPEQALNARYGLGYRQVSAYSRTDGIIVQYTGDNDDFGFGDEGEEPSRAEMETAVTRLAPLFA